MGGVELAKKFVRAVVGETKIAAEELLVEDGCAKKAPHLLFFDRIARSRQNVTSPGENRAGDLPLQRRKKGELTLFKGENRIAAAQLNAVGGNDVINIAGIDG